MSARPEAGSGVVGVARLVDYLKRKIGADRNLVQVAIRGEVTNFRPSTAGHLNFDLKERTALLRCFAWQRDAARFPAFVNGSNVVARGRVGVYEGRGQFQLDVVDLDLDGLGEIHVLFEERKRRFAALGLFEASRKRPLPRHPFRVALVSSRGANGAIDFTRLLAKRSPHVAVVWCETAVQGAAAPEQIAAALDRASRADVDAIVVTRGGGSFEDMFCFSDELVVRAIARAKYPVVSAIGHAADQQLADLAADLHVETPSAAVEALGTALAVLDGRLLDARRRLGGAAAARLERERVRRDRIVARSVLADSTRALGSRVQRVSDLGDALGRGVDGRLRAARGVSEALARRLEARAPETRLAERAGQMALLRRRLVDAARRGDERRSAACAELAARLAGAFERRAARATAASELLAARLRAADPEAILARGYAIVSYGGAIVVDAAAVPTGARIDAKLARGTLAARVERTGGDGDERGG